MARDIKVLTSTSKMLGEMGAQVNKTDKTTGIQSSFDPIVNQINDSYSSPKPSLTPDMGELLTNILNMPHSKKPSPLDK